MFSGKQAENAASKIDKGTALLVEGPTLDEVWEDKHKQKRITKFVRVETYRILPNAGQAIADNEIPPMTSEEVDDYFNGENQ
jgi:single-stranded DNA-binding protein